MNRLEELAEWARRNPLALARNCWQTEQQLSEHRQRLSEALAYIVELKRQLFGARSDKLSPEQEAQLGSVAADLEEQSRRPAPASAGVLEPASEKDLPKRRPPRPRHPIPPEMETRTTVLEPPDAICPHTGQAKRPACLPAGASGRKSRPSTICCRPN